MAKRKQSPSHQLPGLVREAQLEGQLTPQLDNFIRRFVRKSPGFYVLEDREDGEQELLMRVVKYLDKLDPDDCEKWLRTALHRIWLNRIRKQKHYDRQTFADLNRKLGLVPPVVRSRIRADWWRKFDPFHTKP